MLFQKTLISFFVTVHKLLIRFFLGYPFKGDVRKLLLFLVKNSLLLFLFHVLSPKFVGFCCE